MAGLVQDLRRGRWRLRQRWLSRSLRLVTDDDVSLTTRAGLGCAGRSRHSPVTPARISQAMSRCPACRAYSCWTCSRIDSRVGVGPASALNRPPGLATSVSVAPVTICLVSPPCSASSCTNCSTVRSGRARLSERRLRSDGGHSRQPAARAAEVLPQAVDGGPNHAATQQWSRTGVRRATGGGDDSAGTFGAGSRGRSWAGVVGDPVGAGRRRCRRAAGPGRRAAGPGGCPRR